MAKILSAARASRHRANSISQLTIRFVAAATYTTLVGPADMKLPREHPFIAANNNERAKTTITKWKPPYPIPIMSLSTSTSTSDQIQNKDSSVSSSSIGNANPCLDLFYHPGRDISKDDIVGPTLELLPPAWSQDPLTTLKLICEILVHWSCWRYYNDEAFRKVMFWLHQNHPKTLERNVSSIAGLFVNVFQFDQLLTAHLKGQDVMQQKQNAVERYERDPDYRFIHELVSDIFAESLKSDVEKWKISSNDDDQDSWEITGAAQSFLSMDLNFKGCTVFPLRESILRKTFPRESYPEGGEEDGYTRLRKEVLEPLAKYSVRKDPKNQNYVLEKYLKDVKAGKIEIAADALLPNEIVEYVNHWNLGDVAELQWKTMMEKMIHLRKQGKKILTNCLAVCDARELTPQAMNAALGFTVLMSELNEEPWKGKAISFSCSPQLHVIQGDELRYKCDFVKKRMETMVLSEIVDLKKVLDLILEEAVNANLKPDQMIKKVFVFTAFKGFNWVTDYEAIQGKFKEKGYEDAVPQIVHWKMYDQELVMPHTEPGLTMLDGFSNDLVKVCFDNGGEIHPDLIMEAAISRKEYQKLVVVD